MFLNKIIEFNNPKIYSIEGSFNPEDEDTDEFFEVDFVNNTIEEIFTAKIIYDRHDDSVETFELTDIDGHAVPLNDSEIDLILEMCRLHQLKKRKCFRGVYEYDKKLFDEKLQNIYE